MKYFSMFSGVGGFEKGIEQAYEKIFSQRQSDNRRRNVSGSAFCADNQKPSSRNGAKSSANHSHEQIGQSNAARSSGSSSLGRESQLPSCVGYSEIDRFASAIYRHNFPEHRNFGDATRIVPGELPDFDLLVAGFPCQDFSIAGKRQGFNNARGTLFFEIARILSHKKPAHFLLENVAGLASHNDGKTQQEIFRILSEIGYFVERPLLNSKDFGVPQNRERVFFIGHLDGECEREILSFGSGGGEIALKESRGKEDISSCLDANYYKGASHGHQGKARQMILSKDGKPKNKTVASTLTGGGHSGGNHSDMDLIQIGTLRTHKDGEGFREMSENISPSLNARARQDGSQQPIVVVKGRHSERVYDADGIAVTITANPAGGTKNEHYQVANRIRRLTPIECCRLQGFSDDWCDFGDFDGEIKKISDTQIYKVMGNAVTTKVIEALILRMLEKGCLI